MDIFENRLPVLKICATRPKSDIMGVSVDSAQFADIVHIKPEFRERFIELNNLVNNAPLTKMWQQILSRSMTSQKQAEAIRYAEDILCLQTPDISEFSKDDFCPSIEKFCGLLLADTAMSYTERLLRKLVVLSANGTLNPVFASYLSGDQWPFMETDPNQLKLNDMILNRPIAYDNKLMDMWTQYTPKGKLFLEKYVPLEIDMAKALINNRERVLAKTAYQDKKTEDRHPYRQRPRRHDGR